MLYYRQRFLPLLLQQWITHSHVSAPSHSPSPPSHRSSNYPSIGTPTSSPSLIPPTTSHHHFPPNMISLNSNNKERPKKEDENEKCEVTCICRQPYQLSKSSRKQSVVTQGKLRFQMTFPPGLPAARIGRHSETYEDRFFVPKHMIRLAMVLRF